MSIVVDLPVCQYLTPEKRRGWRGSSTPEGEARGEDPNKWYDAIGVRNGPPNNFWRQASDEKVHTGCMDVILGLLENGSLATVVPGIEALEYRMGIATPLLHYKLLGTWAPIFVRGECVATAVVRPEGPQLLSCVMAAAEQLVVPATLNVARVGPRRTKTNGYGTTDQHLDPGEEIVLSLAGSDSTSEARIPARSVNAREEVVWQSNAQDAPLPGGSVPLGQVSLLNDYLLVQRDASGVLADVWMRCDKQPLISEAVDLYEGQPLRDSKAYREAKAEGPG